MISLITRIDARVLESLYAIRDRDTVQILIYITELGDSMFIIGILACLVLVFLARHNIPYVAGILISTTSAAGSVYILKHLFVRLRPDVWYRAYPEAGFSLPSGHAALAVALYGFAVYLIMRSSLSRSVRIFATVILTALIASIAFSRMYLGVHYLSDVIAGLALGGACMWLGITALAKLETWKTSGTLTARALFSSKNNLE